MPTELKMPALSPTMEEGALAKWIVKVGDRVRAGDTLAEIETDKATMEFEATDDGTIIELLVGAGTDAVAVGTVIARLTIQGEEAPAARATTAVNTNGALSQPESIKSAVKQMEPHVASSSIGDDSAERTLPKSSAHYKLTPLARRLAEANRIDLAMIAGSGAGGRIVKADLGLPALAASGLGEMLVKPFTVPAISVHAAPVDVPYDVVKLSSMRKTIARRLTESKQTVPHFYLSIDCKMDALLKLRSDLNDSLADSGVKLSVNDFLIKALALALVEVPEANAQFAGDEIFFFKRVDISMAVAIDGGLITPVIVDAANKRLTVISETSKTLAAQARAGTLRPDQYNGGTASISNLGMFGIERIFPVINPPQAVILGVGSGEQRTYVVDGNVEVATMMTVTASFDHRAIDGAVAARCMAAFRSFVTRPMTMVA